MMKAVTKFVESIQELKSISTGAKGDLDALYNDLINKVKDTKKGTSKATEDVTLRKDPYYTKDNGITTIKKGRKSDSW